MSGAVIESHTAEESDSFRSVAEEAVRWAEFLHAGPAGLLRKRLDALVAVEGTES